MDLEWEVVCERSIDHHHVVMAVKRVLVISIYTEMKSFKLIKSMTIEA